MTALPPGDDGADVAGYIMRWRPSSVSQRAAAFARDVIAAVQPEGNSIMERWVQTCRRELLDRTLVWNESHLLHALREFEHFYNGHRPHQGIANTRPLQPLPVPLADPDRIACLDIRRRDRLGGVLHEYRHAA